MKIVHGDLIKLALAGEFQVIVHGCNCFCTMGAGIAKTIKQVFPEAYAADLKTQKGSRDKLGNYSLAAIDRNGVSVTVVNGYTQFDWRGRSNADYPAIRSVFQRLKRDFAGRSIGYPRIGAGLAGGDWALISRIIDDELSGEDHTLVEYAP